MTGKKKQKINRTKNEDELHFIQSTHLNIILKKRKNKLFCLVRKAH
jgi:hypothetical protein